MIDMPEDQLLRANVHERERDWPEEILLVAKFGKKTYTIPITKEEFFGTGKHGAPMSGDQIINMIHRLRKMKP